MSSNTPRLAIWICGVLSIAMHLGVGFSVEGHEPPPFAFEFELPMDVEFGSTDAMMVAAAEESTGDSDPEPTESTPQTTNSNGEGIADAGVPDVGPMDAGPADTGPVDAGPSDAGPEDTGPADAGAEDATDGEERMGEENGTGTSRVPPGAQLAIRLDMAAIRASRLAPQVRQLLAAIPDWHLILNGSGVDPISDLDRLLIASPNLQRARLVMAGRHAHEEGRAYIEQVAQAMASAHNGSVRWRHQHGVEVSDWPNDDRTRRVLAVISPFHFSISRPQDLVRILGVAQSREEREAAARAEAPDGENGEGEGSEGAESGDSPEPNSSGTAADALLSMAEGEALSFEAEGVHRFVPPTRRDQMPMDMLAQRVRVGLKDTGQGVELAAVGYFETVEEAEAAVTYWSEFRDARAASANFLVRGVIRGIRITQAGDELHVDMNASYLVAAGAIGQVIGMIRSRADRRGLGAVTGRRERPERAGMEAEPRDGESSLDESSSESPTSAMERGSSESEPAEEPGSASDEATD